MAEIKMPAAEATEDVVIAPDLTAHAGQAGEERSSYELAFHVLPTVAEGEVTGVFEALKSIITKAGGELAGEEAPERFDLAYEIVKHLEGKNRKFSSAYFGWIRFKLDSALLGALTSEVEGTSEILRYMIIKLTKVEEANPFRFHEALKSEKMVTTVGESTVVPDMTTVDRSKDISKKEEVEVKKEGGEVDEDELNKALEKKVL